MVFLICQKNLTLQIRQESQIFGERKAVGERERHTDRPSRMYSTLVTILYHALSQLVARDGSWRKVYLTQETKSTHTKILVNYGTLRLV
jgi:hypothetical protein